MNNSNNTYEFIPNNGAVYNTKDFSADLEESAPETIYAHIEDNKPILDEILDGWKPISINLKDSMDWLHTSDREYEELSSNEINNLALSTARNQGLSKIAFIRVEDSTDYDEDNEEYQCIGWTILAK